MSERLRQIALKYLRHIAIQATAMEEVGKEVRFRSWTWFAVLLLIGFAIGGSTGYYLFVRDLNQVSDRLDAIQQQIILVPASEAKPTDAKAGKIRKRH